MSNPKPFRGILVSCATITKHCNVPVILGHVLISVSGTRFKVGDWIYTSRVVNTTDMDGYKVVETLNSRYICV